MDYLIKKTINEDVWSIYLNQDVDQQISSKNTARIQKPRTLKMIKNMKLNQGTVTLLDIGCGIGSDIFSSELKDLNQNIVYYGCDPFNKTKEDNLRSIISCSGGKSDIVTLNNVLNTIPEPEVWDNILNQAKDAVNEDSGVVMILIYEGEKNSKEKAFEKESGEKVPLTPIKTRDGWQNRMKAEKYINNISKTFPNNKLIRTSAGKVILASVNKALDLNNVISCTKKNKLKNKQ